MVEHNGIGSSAATKKGGGEGLGCEQEKCGFVA